MSGDDEGREAASPTTWSAPHFTSFPFRMSFLSAGATTRHISGEGSRYISERVIHERKSDAQTPSHLSFPEACHCCAEGSAPTDGILTFFYRCFNLKRIRYHFFSPSLSWLAAASSSPIDIPDQRLPVLDQTADNGVRWGHAAALTFIQSHRGRDTFRSSSQSPGLTTWVVNLRRGVSSCWWFPMPCAWLCPGFTGRGVLCSCGTGSSGVLCWRLRWKE